VKVAVFAALGLHVAFLAILLAQGCRHEPAVSKERIINKKPAHAIHAAPSAMGAGAGVFVSGIRFPMSW